MNRRFPSISRFSLALLAGTAMLATIAPLAAAVGSRSVMASDASGAIQTAQRQFNSGNYTAAIKTLQSVAQVSANAEVQYWIGRCYYELRDYPNLIEAGRRALLVDPNDWSQHYHLGIGYEGVGKLQDAIAEYQKSIELSDDDPGAIVSLAHAYLAVGKRAEAEKILRDLERKSKGADVSPYTMATLYAGLGDKDRAFELLDKAYSERSFDISSVQADLRLDNLRPDARFQHLLGRMGLTSPTFSMGSSSQK